MKTNPTANASNTNKAETQSYANEKDTSLAVDPDVMTQLNIVFSMQKLGLG